MLPKCRVRTTDQFLCSDGQPDMEHVILVVVQVRNTSTGSGHIISAPDTSPTRPPPRGLRRRLRERSPSSTWPRGGSASLRPLARWSCGRHGLDRAARASVARPVDDLWSSGASRDWYGVAAAPRDPALRRGGCTARRTRRGRRSDGVEAKVSAPVVRRSYFGAWRRRCPSMSTARHDDVKLSHSK